MLGSSWSTSWIISISRDIKSGMCSCFTQQWMGVTVFWSDRLAQSHSGRRWKTSYPNSQHSSLVQQQPNFTVKATRTFSVGVILFIHWEDCYDNSWGKETYFIISFEKSHLTWGCFENIKSLLTWCDVCMEKYQTEVLTVWAECSEV